MVRAAVLRVAAARWLAKVNRVRKVRATVIVGRQALATVSAAPKVPAMEIVPALKAGCRVVKENPMTVDADRCARILDTDRETGNSLTVAFNYSFNTVHEKVRALLAEGAIG